MAYEEVTSPILTDATGQDIVDKLDEIAQNLQPPTNIEASDVSYDNTQSGMTATDVQEAVDELKSNLIKCVVLTTSINITYQDANSIGFRNTVANAVDITTLQGYPTGKTIIGAIPIGNEAIISATFAIVNGTELHATSKISGTRSCTIYVLYTD